MTSNVVRISKADLTANPRADWNAFIDLLAMKDYRELDPRQRAAHLVFWYESEVQNGGHFQYFANQSGERADETVSALEAIGAPAHADVLRRALARWQAYERLPPADSEEFVASALESEFADLDRAFHSCATTLVTVLERHLAQFEADYIVRE
jgi:hypothetical protein